MDQNLMDQVGTLAKLADADLRKVVAELSLIFKIGMPVFEPGTDKRQYVISVFNQVEAACKKMTPEQAVAKADKVVKYNETQNPGMWSWVMKLLRFVNRKN